MIVKPQKEADAGQEVGVDSAEEPEDDENRKSFTDSSHDS